MAVFAELLVNNKTLETVDLQNNKVLKVAEVASMKKADMATIVQTVKTCLKFLPQLKNLTKLQINEWLFDCFEYPDALVDSVKEARMGVSEKVAYNTVSSATPGKDN